MLNLSSLLENSSRIYPEKEAVVFGDKQFTYSQINVAANQVANALNNLGIGKGDKVALSCLNIPYFPIAYFGILKIGASVVPLSVLLKNEEVAYHLKDSGAKMCICFEGTEELPMGEEAIIGFQKTSSCEHMVIIPADPSKAYTRDGVTSFLDFTKGQSPKFNTSDTNADDVAVIVYTSGTTGQPKGAQLTHSNLLLNAMICSDLFKSTPEDKLLIVLPLFHIFGMTCLMNAGFYKGCTTILLPRFDGPTVIGLLDKHDITVFAGVPTMYWGLLNTVNQGANIEKIKKTLRLAISGGASLPQTILEEFNSKFAVPLLEGYGMSEGSPVVTFNQLDFGTKPNSIGTPVWGVDVKIVNEDGEEMPVGERGELIYKGHNVMKGYYNRPEANASALKNGWLHSGDIAIKDEDGFFFIVDRKKDMVLRGGLNVYPREVEEVMMKHPSVSLVAVIGTPDEKLGEEVKAFVQLKPDTDIREEDLITWTKERIAAYKYPRQIKFIDQMPTSATGKILKKVLRKDY